MYVEFIKFFITILINIIDCKTNLSNSNIYIADSATVCEKSSEIEIIQNRPNCPDISCIISR